MDMDTLSQMRLMPGDIRLIDEIMFELKSKGIFDTFRKDCIADVDTRPAYQNLRQRVESSVHNFLSRQSWVPEMNKNQMREKLRKHIMDGNYLEQGVERIVDQVVNPKVNTIFKPQVEDLVYNYYGVPRPKKTEEDFIDLTENLLPNDLEAVSPGSVTNEKEMDVTIDEDNNSTEKMEEDKENINIPEDNKSPTFEPVCKSQGILLPDEPEPLPGIIDLTLNDVESIDNPMDIPLPGEDVNAEDIPAPDSTPPDINIQNIQMPDEPNSVEIYNIPLPEEMPPEAKPANSDDFNFKPIDSDEDSISSSDSSLRRNMSPLTPIRNFDNDNSYDAQQAFESTDSPEKKDDNKVESIIPISTFRFTIESKDSESSSDGVTKSKKTIAMTSYKTGNEIKTYSSPLLQAYDDSSSSNNLHIDYESDNSKLKFDSKLMENEQNSESRDITKKESKSEDKRSGHKSSHSSRDKHRDNKLKRSDSKHSSSRDKKDLKSDKKSSKDDSKYKSHRDSPKETDRKESKSKESSRHSSSHKSSNSKERSSSHRHSSSSSKQSDEKKLSNSRDKNGKHSDYKSSKDSKSSRDHKSKDRKSSSSRSKNSDEKDKKDKKSTDDHYSLSGRGSTNRRSTDRDSNDGNSSSSKGSNINSTAKTAIEKKGSKTSSKSENTSSSSETTAQSDSIEQTNNGAIIDETPHTIPPVIRCDNHLGTPICEVPQVNYEENPIKVKKPKFAPNFEEAKRLMKLRDIMNAEEIKKKQDAALLLEFQQNVRPNLSQVYSSISGPELEFACSVSSNNYTVQVNVEPIMENVTNEAIEENTVNELNDQVMEQSMINYEYNGLDTHRVAEPNDNYVNEMEIKLENDIKQETIDISDNEDFSVDNTEVKTEFIVDHLNEIERKDINMKIDKKIKMEASKIVPPSESNKDFYYFSEIEKYVAEIERDTFSVILKELTDTIEKKTKLYLINCNGYTKEIVKEISSDFGEYEIVNISQNGKLPNKPVKEIKVISNEIVLPVTDEKIDIFSPIKNEEIEYGEIKSEIKTKQEIMEIIFGVPADSPSKIPNVNLGNQNLVWNGDSRGVKRKLSLEHDNNNKDVLSPSKIHLNNDCEHISSTGTDTELSNTNKNNNENNAHAKYVGRAQRVGLPKPKRISLPISPSSVENYENSPKPNETANNCKIKPKKSYIQRYERSDLYKPKLHYLSKRNMT